MESQCARIIVVIITTAIIAVLADGDIVDRVWHRVRGEVVWSAEVASARLQWGGLEEKAMAYHRTCQTLRSVQSPKRSLVLGPELQLLVRSHCKLRLQVRLRRSWPGRLMYR